MKVNLLDANSEKVQKPFPKLMINNDTDDVALFINENERVFLLSPNGIYSVKGGSISDAWADYDGTVELSNE